MRTLASLLLAAAAATAQTNFVGHWEGSVAAPDGPKNVTLDLARNAKGAWIGSLGVPEQHATGLRVAGIQVEGSKLTFNSPDLPSGATLALTLDGDKLSGTVMVRGMSLPVELTRKGEAKVEITPPSPAVSKELEGDWSGEIALPNGARPVNVHFKNQADQTVLGSIDSPAQGAQGLELANIKQSGKEVSFELALKAAGGSYKGTLNAAGNEIAGAWTQRPGLDPLPLTFKKK